MSADHIVGTNEMIGCAVRWSAMDHFGGSTEMVASKPKTRDGRGVPAL